jgi:hypothetical protein
MREHDRFGQGHEQEFRHAGQEEHRHEHDADTECRHECGHGDLLRAIENRPYSVFPLREVPLDIFDGYRGVVDEDADGESQPAERHDVDGLMERAQHHDRDQNRERYGDGDDQRAAPAAQEQQNHQRRQARGDQSFADYPLHGCAHKN